jgi:hypothetical protein
LADLGADCGAGDGAGVGEGDLLGVTENPEVDLAVFVLGTAPEVEAVGEEGVMLGFDDDKEEGKAALAEVLALSTFILGEGAAGGAGRLAGGLTELALVCKGCTWS